MSRWRNGWRALAPALLAFGLATGCGSAAEQAAVSMRDWSLTAEDVARACAEIRGPGVFDSMSVQRRVDFAQALADREILLRLARQENVTIDRRRERRGYRIDYEKTLIREFRSDLRRRFRPSKADEDRDLPRLLRAAETEQFLVIHRERAAQAAEALRGGRDFLQTAAAFSDVSPPPGRPAPPPVRSMRVRIDDRQAPGVILNEALLRDLPPGGVSGPIQMPEGTIFLRVLGYEPIAEASDTSWVRQAKQALANLLWVDRSRAWSDSLKQASGLASHPESYPLIAERFMAWWDSIESVRSEGFIIDALEFRPPTWRFTAEELARPVYDLRGRTHGIADYLSSLEEIDLEYWPGMTSQAKLAAQFDARIERILLADEAARRGFTEGDALQQALRRVEEKWMLESYFAHVTASVPDPGPDTLQAAFQRYRERLAYPEALSFNALVYPPAAEARAREIAGRLRSGPPGLLAEIGPAEATGHGAWHVARTQLRNVALGPIRPEFADLWPIAKGLQEGEYSELFRTSTGHWAIVRTVQRRPARDRTLAEARPFLVAKTKGVEQNRIMADILSREREVLGLVIRPELLQDWTPEARDGR